MLTKPLSKIDRFYPILALVVVGLVILIIYTLNGVFRALNTASEFDPALASPATKINKAKLDEVFGKIKDKNVPAINQAP